MKASTFAAKLIGRSPYASVKMVDGHVNENPWVSPIVARGVILKDCMARACIGRTRPTRTQVMRNIFVDDFPLEVSEFDEFRVSSDRAIPIARAWAASIWAYAIDVSEEDVHYLLRLAGIVAGLGAYKSERIGTSGQFDVTDFIWHAS